MRLSEAVMRLRLAKTAERIEVLFALAALGAQGTLYHAGIRLGGVVAQLPVSTHFPGGSAFDLAIAGLL